MYPRLFDLRYLNTFGICISIGLILCFTVARYYGKAKKQNQAFVEFSEGNAYVAIFVGMLTSFVGQALFTYLKNPGDGFHLTTASTFVSGLFGGIGSFLIGYLAIGRKKFGPRLIEVMIIAPVCITITHAFGRLGCFFAGCCYGKPTDSFLGVRFPNLLHKVYPTQLFESAFLFVLFAILFFLVFRKNFTQAFAVYLFAYGTFRFFIEFIRGDERGAFLGSLSPSQSLAILMITGSIGFYFLTKNLLGKYRKNTKLRDKISI
jgi:phosphatidylglycerol---prolipoprotein diacylglyceryl transferase